MRSKKLVQIYANILHLRFTDVFASLPPHTLNAISLANFWKRLGQVLLYTGGRLVLNLFLPLRNPEDIRGKIWLYVVSKNNYDSLFFLKEKLPEALFVAGQNKQIGIYNAEVNRLSTRFKIFYLYKFLSLWWGLYQLKGKLVNRFFDLIFVATGYYELSLRHLKKYRPTAIIFANDHNTDPRALLLAAKSLGIPTIYIQHASVSTSFPPLQFDLSLLEGQDALDKYRQCGPITGEVKLIGMPKADEYVKQKNQGTIIQRVGICANTIDELEPIQELVKALIKEFPEMQFTFRPHPGDKRDFSFIQDFGNQVEFSDSKTESAFAFLQQQDALIAADSSIHLEATMLNILSLYYRFNDNSIIDDYYGYVKQRLIQRANNIAAVIDFIRTYEFNRPLVYERAQYYNAVMGTTYEGRSHELAINYIQTFLSQR